MIAAGVIVGLLFAIRYYKETTADLPRDLSAFRTFRPLTACQIYDADGALLDEFHLERRFWVALAELPDVVWQAFVAAEDRRFFAHKGVDYRGLVRAAKERLVNDSRQGGSTITQQLVKNLIVGSERSYRRKLREAVVARRLEKIATKRQILELYVNYVYLGNGNYGVEAAARDYFGVSAKDLNAGQASVLAALVPAPNRASPWRSPTAAARRGERVLRTMANLGYISNETLARHLKRPVRFRQRSAEPTTVAAAYATAVRREIRRLFGHQVPLAHGLRIYTGLDTGIQRVATKALRDGVEAVQARQGMRYRKERLAKARWPAFLAQAPGVARDEAGELLRPEPGGCFHALVDEKENLSSLRAGPWSFALTAPEQAVLRAAKSGSRRPAKPAEQSHAGDVLRVCALTDTSTVRLDGRPFADGAVVVVENATGNIIALVGGYEERIEGFVRAIQARRQPGSSFKPYVYAAALEAGRNQFDIVTDSPISFPGLGGKPWRPRNYSGTYLGNVPLRTALAKSLNTVAVKLAAAVGPNTVVDLAARMGVRTPLRTDLTVALGSSELTPMDQALGFATIARGGLTVEPVFITTLEDVNRTMLGHAGDQVKLDGKPVARLPGGRAKSALRGGVAYELADMMREVFRSGTARRAAKPGFDWAGKTGTTNDFVDAWFVGFTPRYTVAVWIGTDGTTPLGDGETGGRAALPVWSAIVGKLPGLAGERFPVPDDAILIKRGKQWFGFPRGEVPASLLVGGTSAQKTRPPPSP